MLISTFTTRPGAWVTKNIQICTCSANPDSCLRTVRLGPFQCLDLWSTILCMSSQTNELICRLITTCDSVAGTVGTKLLYWFCTDFVPLFGLFLTAGGQEAETFPCQFFPRTMNHLRFSSLVDSHDIRAEFFFEIWRNSLLNLFTNLWRHYVLLKEQRSARETQLILTLRTQTSLTCAQNSTLAFFLVVHLLQALFDGWLAYTIMVANCSQEPARLWELLAICLPPRRAIQFRCCISCTRRNYTVSTWTTWSCTSRWCGRRWRQVTWNLTPTQLLEDLLRSFAWPLSIPFDNWAHLIN